MKFTEKVARFMVGRYGNDKFSRFLIALYFIFMVTYLFTRIFLFNLLALAVMIYMLYRMLSKKIYVRQKENNRYLLVRGKIIGWLKFNSMRIKDIKTRRYRHCPSCKAVLRLPKTRGKHKAVCPKCGNTFDVHVRI